MHPNYRISLFLVLLLLPVTLIFAQQDEPTPTGTLAYSVYTADVDVALHLFALTDQTSTRISPQGAGREDAFPVFSPDGGRIAFLADGFLSFMGVNGEGLITTDIENPLYVSWSSDNSQVVYITETDDVYALHVYDVDDEENRAYDGDLIVSIDSLPTWTVDGTAILLSARESENVRSDIYALSADFATFTNLTNTVGVNESSPAMSPNGLFISYKMEATGGPLAYIWMINSDGSNRRQLTDFSLPLGSLYTPHVWSPDSTRFLVEDAGNGVAIINIVTGEVVDFNAITAVWSPDGQQIAYTTIMMNNKSGVALYDVYVASANTPDDTRRIIQGAFGKIAWQPDPSITFEPVTLATPTPSATATPSVPQAQIESVLVQGQQGNWYFDGDEGLSVTIILQSGA
ncbi:MAG: PD40 domain-containing protein, partial [Anaerolineae bacterium]|nr:PD40 domain-containing protein [Anaerolineae bacterium]